MNIANRSIETSEGNVNSIPMTVIERSDIPSLTSVQIGECTHQLGIVKDFRMHETIAKFLPEEPERVSFSWVRLLAGEVLAVHSHPTATLILVCDGEGYFTGDVTGRLSSGSAVMVPPNCYHGFCGAGEHGFWAVSIQFESLGLYEDVSNARTSFSNNAIKKSNALEFLLQAHNFFMEDYKNSFFFDFINGDEVKNPIVLEKFLDNFQFISTNFQKILKARVENSQSELERNLAIEHLEEEKDHDINLAKFRGNPDLSPTDEALEEVLAWFENEMRTKSDAEKIVLMHFVLEGSGELAHQEMYQITKDLPVGEHFLLHQEEDDGHFMMGVDALKEIPELEIEKLLTTLITGWSQLNKMCELAARTAQSVVR